MSSSLEIQLLASREEAVECARLMAGSDPWITLKRTVESSLATLTDPAKEVYVVRDSGGVAAFVILDLRGPFAGYLQTICVRPDCRGRGLGTLLIEWAENRIFQQSPNVFMCVSSFNAGARRLYERLGYEVVGVLRSYVVPEHDEVLLRKTRGSLADFPKGTLSNE
ncbi:MAG: GNAT family N-acetyltransferase [Acidimicrobiia bacterium]